MTLPGKFGRIHHQLGRDSVCPAYLDPNDPLLYPEPSHEPFRFREIFARAGSILAYRDLPPMLIKLPSRKIAVLPAIGHQISLEKTFVWKLGPLKRNATLTRSSGGGVRSAL